MKNKFIILLLITLTVLTVLSFSNKSEAFGSGSATDSFQCFYHNQPYYLVFGGQQCPTHPDDQPSIHKEHRIGDPECYEKLPTI